MAKQNGSPPQPAKGIEFLKSARHGRLSEGLTSNDSNDTAESILRKTRPNGNTASETIPLMRSLHSLQLPLARSGFRRGEPGTLARSV